MKYIKQFSIILAVSFAGETASHFIPLPVPGSIYGLVFLLILLMLKIVKPEHIKETSVFLIGIMPIIFVAPTVGIISLFTGSSGLILPIIIISLVSTVIVFLTTGCVSQAIIRSKKKRENDK